MSAARRLEETGRRLQDRVGAAVDGLRRVAICNFPAIYSRRRPQASGYITFPLYTAVDGLRREAESEGGGCGSETGREGQL